MPIRALFAAAAVIAIPIVANGEGLVGPPKDADLKKICRVHIETGSRLAQVRRCMSKREEEQYRKEIEADLSRQQIDRRGH